VTCDLINIFSVIFINHILDKAVYFLHMYLTWVIRIQKYTEFTFWYPEIHKQNTFIIVPCFDTKTLISLDPLFSHQLFSVIILPFLINLSFILVFLKKTVLPNSDPLFIIIIITMSILFYMLVKKKIAQGWVHWSLQCLHFAT
jgi:hypothetical protein